MKIQRCSEACGVSLSVKGFIGSVAVYQHWMRPETRLDQYQDGTRCGSFICGPIVAAFIYTPLPVPLTG
jgi:hypothetical protein